MYFVLFFFRVSVFFYATVYAIAQMLHLRSYRVLVPTFGVLILCFAMTAFNNTVEHAYWGENVAAVYSSFFEILLPLVTLIVVTIKGLSIKKEVSLS